MSVTYATRSTAWTPEEDRILQDGIVKGLTSVEFGELLPRRSPSAVHMRTCKLRKIAGGDREPVLASDRENRVAAETGSDALLRAMFRYGLRHGHLLSLSMAQVRARATVLGILL